MAASEQPMHKATGATQDERQPLLQSSPIRSYSGTVEEAGSPSEIVEGSEGLGRHLGLASTTFLIIGRTIGSGIFSVPAFVLQGVGSPGAALVLWVLAAIVSFAGLFIWVEYGSIWPKSGGEKVYLEVVWTRPKLLVTIMFSTHAVLLGFTAGGCIVFAKNIAVAFAYHQSRLLAQWVAMGVLIAATLLHGLFPEAGVRTMNYISICKIITLAFIVISGWAVLLGLVPQIEDPWVNFRHPFEGSATDPSAYAWGLYKTMNSFIGWNTASAVLGEVKKPIQTIRLAGPLALGCCTVLYLLANISYLAVAPVQELKEAGVTIAGLFFRKVFGPSTQRVLSALVALSALGNVMSVTFAQARINQELAKEGVIPWPKFWASNWPCKSPFGSLILHFIPSAIIILAPPPGEIYALIIDLEGYTREVLNFMIVIGLVYLRYKKPNMFRPFKVWTPLIVLYLIASTFLLIVPLLPTPSGHGDNTTMAYWVLPVSGLGVFAIGIIYWVLWQKILPWAGGYRLVPTTEQLEDGCHVTVYKHQKLE